MKKKIQIKFFINIQTSFSHHQIDKSQNMKISLLRLYS